MGREADQPEDLEALDREAERAGLVGAQDLADRGAEVAPAAQPAVEGRVVEVQVVEGQAAADQFPLRQTRICRRKSSRRIWKHPGLWFSRRTDDSSSLNNQGGCE